MARFEDKFEPMTLGNMRANGVRSLDVSCWLCHHRSILSAEPWPGRSERHNQRDRPRRIGLCPCDARHGREGDPHEGGSIRRRRGDHACNMAQAASTSEARPASVAKLEPDPQPGNRTDATK
jgi:hypothetical protein